MKTAKFSEIKEELQRNLEEKLKASPIPNEAGFTIIEGFMSFSIQGDISNNVVIGGPVIPMIGIVGNTSGRIYMFALRILMPKLWEN
jgi:hypothetical protein